MDSRAESDGSDPVERLLLTIVDLPAGEQRAALARVVAAEPGLAPRLEERFELYQRFANAGPPAEGAPRSFGEYELVRELGRGGMGIVYLARQRRGDQQRLVALKLLRDRALGSPQARERLHREAAAAFRLDHPGICQVLDTGEVDDTPFLTMRYVPGATLAERIAAARTLGTRLDLPRNQHDESHSSTSATTATTGSRPAALALIEQVARALHTAHEAGLVHRDVKPGNIMVTPEGAPVLLDFGLVHDASSSRDLTAAGAPLGTPAYMSPEQIDSKGDHVDRTTDVYSLGATLYEALTLRAPFTGQTREALFHEILAGSTPDLRGLVPAASRDLRVVTATAMARDPKRRYATALAFAEDLRRVRLAQPILARPPGPLRRLQLWCRRNPAAAALLLLLAVALAANVGSALQAARRATEAEVAKTEAQADFATARDAIGELAMLARSHLADVPWLEAERRELLERALAFQREILARKSGEPRLQRDDAILRVQLASVAASLSDGDAAARELQEAIAVLSAGAASGDREAMGWLARAWWIAAELAQERGDPTTSTTAARGTIAALQTLRAQRPLSGWEAATLAHAHRTTAENLIAQNDLAGAAAELDAAMQLDGPPDDDRVDLARSEVLLARARLHRLRREPDRATADLERAIALVRIVRQSHPHDRRSRVALASALTTQGTHLAAQDELDAAMTAYDEALAGYENLVAMFPLAKANRTNLANLLGNRATAQRRLGRGQEAQRGLERAVSLLQEVVAQNPDSAAAIEDLARNRYVLANGLGKEQRPEAIEHYRAALAALEGLLRDNPDTTRLCDLASRTATSLAAKLAMEARDAEALAAFAVARRHDGVLLRLEPDNPQWHRNQATLLYNEGTLACETGDLAAAGARLEEAVAADEKYVAIAPSDPRGHAQLAKHWLRLAQIATLRDPVTALTEWQAAAEALGRIPESLRRRVDAVPDTRAERFAITRGLGASLVAAGRLDAAAGTLAQARAASPGEPGNLTEQVEHLLLDAAFAQLAAARADTTAVHDALRAVLQRAAAMHGTIGTSRLHCARIRAALPTLLNLATAHGVADDEGHLARLQTAASGER